MSSDESRQPALVLTGERPRGRMLVWIYGCPLWLTGGQFDLLLRLIIARGNQQTGFLGAGDGVYPVAVYRLRKVIDSACGPGMGKGIIETGAIEEYRLGFTIDRVQLDPSFWELPIPSVLSYRQAEQLRTLCDGVKSQG